MNNPNNSINEIIKEFKKKINELRSMISWEGKDSPNVDFGHRTTARDHDGIPMYVTIVDWGNIKSFLKQKLRKFKDDIAGEYAHSTADGLCCACHADIVFMEAEIQRRVNKKLNN